MKNKLICIHLFVLTFWKIFTLNTPQVLLKVFFPQHNSFLAHTGKLEHSVVRKAIRTLAVYTFFREYFILSIASHACFLSSVFNIYIEYNAYWTQTYFFGFAGAQNKSFPEIILLILLWEPTTTELDPELIFILISQYSNIFFINFSLPVLTLGSCRDWKRTTVHWKLESANGAAQEKLYLKTL